MKYFSLLFLVLMFSSCSNANYYLLDNEYSGWGDYVDSEYNSSNRLTINNNILTNFSNDGLIIRGNQIPNYINNTGGYYNGTHILGRNGDAYLIALRFKAEPQSPNTFCQFTYNIGEPVGSLPARLITFPKGAGIEQNIKFSGVEYTLDTWQSNGALVQVLCDGGDVEFWDISYEFFNLHKSID